MIVLQLKSSHDEHALSDISNIISSIKNKHGYRIRGHEIHQNPADSERSIKQRAHTISSFCLKNDIEYITYHAPILRDQLKKILDDERSCEKAKDSLLATLREAELVYNECAFKDKVVIVYHLPSVISLEEIHYLNKELKFKILEKAEQYLLDFNEQNRSYFESFAMLTVENVFPKYYGNGLNYSTINMFHPLEIIKLNKSGINMTFDLSHYNIYSGYLSHGSRNDVADLDRQIYGFPAPSWIQCIDIFGDSLRQLHINDGRAADASSEGLMLGEGDIPVIPILRYIHDRTEKNEGRIMQGTIEIVDGHLNNSKLQNKALEWLLVNATDLFQ
jgi:hypothetical protein